jgi:23S rRNA pseudouridine1911/1915/1917 synthase
MQGNTEDVVPDSLSTARDNGNCAESDDDDDDDASVAEATCSLASSSLPASIRGSVLRPGIVHRLDRGTTGLMVACRSDAAMLSLGAQFRDRTV